MVEEDVSRTSGRVMGEIEVPRVEVETGEGVSGVRGVGEAGG